MSHTFFFFFKKAHESHIACNQVAPWRRVWQVSFNRPPSQTPQRLCLHDWHDQNTSQAWGARLKKPGGDSLSSKWLFTAVRQSLWWKCGDIRILSEIVTGFFFFFSRSLNVQYRQEDRWGWEHVLLNVRRLSSRTLPHTSLPSLDSSLISSGYVILISELEAMRERSLVVGKSLATCGESFEMLSHFKLLISCSKRICVLRRQPLCEELEDEGLDSGPVFFFFFFSQKFLPLMSCQTLCPCKTQKACRENIMPENRECKDQYAVFWGYFAFNRGMRSVDSVLNASQIRTCIPMSTCCRHSAHNYFLLIIYIYI